MLHTTNPVIKHKAGLLNLAEELSNVSKACKIMGVSRDTFYRYRELADEGGVNALINRSRRTPNLKNRTDVATEQAVVDYAIAFPAHGQHRTSNELRNLKALFVCQGEHSCSTSFTRLCMTLLFSGIFDISSHHQLSVLWLPGRRKNIFATCYGRCWYWIRDPEKWFKKQK